MDYEKAYKEVLEKAKKELATCGSMNCDAAKQIIRFFPELVESEDERIRRVIHKLMLGIRREIFTSQDESVTKEKVLCWLEKQKEQKPVQSKDEKEYVRTLKGLVSDFIRDCGGAITDIGYYQQVCDWLDGKHVEQKPAEWSEEDERIRKAVLDEIEQQIEIMPDVDDMDSDDQDRYNELISMSIWMEDLPKCMKPSWKPSEQKYDGNMDKECIKLCDILNSIPSVDTFESCCGHLKDRYSIWFFCNDIITISRFGRCVERNYSDGKWELLVDSTDTHPTGVFWLRSKEPFQSYDEMEKSVNGLCNCIQHWLNTEFDSYFNGNACK